MRALYGENKKITDGNYDKSLAVKCINGTFVGKKEKNVIAFRGIPFVGKQPVGELRWKAPVEFAPDDVVYEAHYFGQGIIDEMRPHLQHHDTGAFMGDFFLLLGDFLLLVSNLFLLPGNFLVLPDDFLLMTAVLLDLIGQDEAVHGQRGEDVAEVYEREDIGEQVYGQRDHDR